MHLNEKLAEFVYEELSSAEMTAARRHLSECADCQARVNEFEGIHHALKAMPDEDLPRRVVIPAAEPSRPRFALPLRWLAPVGAAAAIVLVLGLVGPIHTEWGDSALTITLGKPAASIPVSVGPPVQQVQQIDYQRVVNQVRAEQQAWLTQEIARLENLAVTNKKDLGELRGAFVSLEAWQQTSWREIQRNGGDIQLIAQKSGE